MAFDGMDWQLWVNNLQNKLHYDILITEVGDIICGPGRAKTYFKTSAKWAPLLTPCKQHFVCI